MILVTGANGYIGRNFCSELNSRNIHFVGIDNFSTTKKKNHYGSEEDQTISCDVLETAAIVEIIKKYKVTSVVHLAGLKSVRESESEREKYFINNVKGTESLLKSMTMTGVKNIIFASTAGVYKYMENKRKYKEESEISPASVYGQTKVECEVLLSRFVQQNLNSSAVALRFFNVGGEIGAHLTEENGENVFPAILAAIRGEKSFQIFGLDYQTPDGSAIRDYIHVKDLTEALILCSKNQLNGSLQNFKVFNLGTSYGTSVLELVEAFEKTFGVRINIEITPRRDGDVPCLLADSGLAADLLGWKPANDLLDIAKSYLYRE